MIRKVFPDENRIEYIKNDKVIHSIIGEGVDIVFLDAIPSVLGTTINTDITLLIQSNIPEKIKVEIGDGSNRYVDLIDMEAEITFSYSTPGKKYINVLAGLEIRSIEINIV